MPPISVDPEVLSGAGESIGSVGDEIAAAVSTLASNLSGGARSGLDPAGLAFGHAYGQTAQGLLDAGAAAVNAGRGIGFGVRMSATNYSRADASSTIGGGASTLTPPEAPADFSAPGAPSALGGGVPPPLLWSVIQTFIPDVWPERRWRRGPNFNDAWKGARMTPKISEDLQEWARRASYDLTPSDASGAALFWSVPGGETRLYIRETSDGSNVLTRSERGGAEQFVLSAPTLCPIERYLWGLFGADIRSVLGLPRIDIPSEITDLAQGYELSELGAASQRTLRRADGEAVAVARGRTLSVWTLVELSRLLSASVEDLKASYEDSSGRPLFHV